MPSDNTLNIIYLDVSNSDDNNFIKKGDDSIEYYFTHEDSKKKKLKACFALLGFEFPEAQPHYRSIVMGH